MTLTKADIIAMLKGLGIAIIGAALTYLTQWLTKTDFGQYTPIVMIVWSVVANAIRKLIDQPVQNITGLSI